MIPLNANGLWGPCICFFDDSPCLARWQGDNSNRTRTKAPRGVKQWELKCVNLFGIFLHHSICSSSDNLESISNPMIGRTESTVMSHFPVLSVCVYSFYANLWLLLATDLLQLWIAMNYLNYRYTMLYLYHSPSLAITSHWFCPVGALPNAKGRLKQRLVARVAWRNVMDRRWPAAFLFRSWGWR